MKYEEREDGTLETMYHLDGGITIVTRPPFSPLELQRNTLADAMDHFSAMLVRVTSIANGVGSERMSVDPDAEVTKVQKINEMEHFDACINDLHTAFIDLIYARYNITAKE